MNYIKTKISSGSTATDINNKLIKNQLQSISTGRILMHLLNKHKFMLVTVYAVLFTLWHIPFVPDLIKSMIN